MRRGRIRHELLVAWVYAAIMAASALPTPLYTLYRQRLGLHAVDITVLYAFYAIVVLTTLVCAGSVSDRMGRQPVQCLSVAAAGISEAILVFAPNLPGLYVSRGLVGIAVGLAIASLPAYLADLAGEDRPHRATMLGIAANMGGQALGTLLAGLIAMVVADPLSVPYVAGLFLLLPVIFAIPMVLPETVLPSTAVSGRRERGDESARRRLRAEYRATAVSIVAAFAMFGFLTAMTGHILEQRMHSPSTLLAGVLTAILFIAGAAGQIIARAATFARNPAITVLPLPIAALFLCAAIVTGSVVIFTAAVVVCGIGGGVCLRAGSMRLLTTSHITVRARASSRIYAALYLGAALPTMAAGLLATTVNIIVSTTVLAMVVAVLATAAAVLLGALSPVGGSPADAVLPENDARTVAATRFPAPFADSACSVDQALADISHRAVRPL
jgi:MFS family permease